MPHVSSILKAVTIRDDGGGQPASKNDNDTSNAWRTTRWVSTLTVGGAYIVSGMPGAAENPVVRATTSLSLICAIIGLTCAAVLFIRLSSIGGSTNCAFKYEVQRKYSWIRWVVVWMPALWTSWGVCWLTLSVLSLFFRSRHLDASAHMFGAYAITAVTILGILCFCLVQRLTRLK